MNAELIPWAENFAIIRDNAFRLSQERQAVTGRAKNVRYLEIGCNMGHSLWHTMNSGVISRAVVVDTWGDQAGGKGMGSPKHVIDILGEKFADVVFLTSSSHDLLPKLTGLFDLIFVDGDHTGAGAWLDMEQALPLLAPGGAMLVDDIDNPSVGYIRGLVETFAKFHRLKVEWWQAHYGVAVLTR